MPTLSYNEQQTRQLELRHIFFPSAYGLVSEITVGIVALILFNLNSISHHLFGRELSGTSGDPLHAPGSLVTHRLDSVLHGNAIQAFVLFIVWAVVGALIYVLLFRLAQLLFGAKSSLGTGLHYVREAHTDGLIRWLATLHDFFVKAILFILGAAAVSGGALLCFGIASQELRNGLVNGFPGNMWQFVLSLLAAILSVRFVALGISLLSARFRNWYTA